MAPGLPSVPTQVRLAMFSIPLQVSHDPAFPTHQRLPSWSDVWDEWWIVLRVRETAKELFCGLCSFLIFYDQI